MQGWDVKIFAEGNLPFNRLALELFGFQYENNTVYRDYANYLDITPDKVQSLTEIPFLPVRFFKSHEVKTTTFEPALIFESSGTTATINSCHYVKEPALYEKSFLTAFRQFYGEIKGWCVLGLLPSYLERENSSLVYMVKKLIKESGHTQSGFFLHDYQELNNVIAESEANKQKTLVIGVTYALLDFAEKFPPPLSSTIIMETGGMKGRREELIREEVHEKLKNAFGLKTIHSEYGMTELLSQAYSKGDGIFECPPWMKVLVRDEEDPFLIKEEGKGAVNIVDLANIYSCAFIATDDAGKINADGCFEILGRMDGSDLRGCSLLTV
jgi:Acyl-protein synthetase, LuxE